MSYFSFIVWILMIVCPCAGFTDAIYLKDSLKRAHVGDYIVTSQGKMATTWRVLSVDANKIIIEEISIPSRVFSQQGISWASWLGACAPGYTSWIQFTIDLDSGYAHHFFSRTTQSYFQISSGDNLLATLLNLKLADIPQAARKRIGQKPLDSGLDQRAIWQPALTYQGQRVPNAKFAGWHARWPKDKTPLSEREVEVYTPLDSSYPSYFPYWIQIRGLAGQATLRVIDSGSYQQLQEQSSSTFSG